MRDITGLKNQLPPLPNGAGPWIQAFKAYTQGVCLAIGDIRGIVGPCAGQLTLEKIETLAGTVEVPHEEPFGGYVEHIFDAMRDLFPVNTSAVAGFTHPWVDGSNITPNAWVFAGKEKWISLTGEEPTESTPAMMMFKEKMLTEVPGLVKTQMLDNPLVSTAPWHQWAQCLIQLLDRHRSKVRSEVASQMAATASLTQMQIEQHKKGSKSAPKEDELKAIIMATVWEVVEQPQGEGDGDRGSKPGRCNYCGIPGHWIRECRKRLRNEERRGQGGKAGGRPSQVGPTGQYPA